MGHEQAPEPACRRLVRREPPDGRTRIERMRAAENRLRSGIELGRPEGRHEAGAPGRSGRPRIDRPRRLAAVGCYQKPAGERPRELFDVARFVGVLTDRPVIENELGGTIGYAQPPVPVHPDLDHHGRVDDEAGEQIRYRAQTPPAEQGVASVQRVRDVDRARAAAEHAMQEQDEVLTQRGRRGEQLRQPPPAHFPGRGPCAFRLPVDDRLEVLVGQAGESQRRVAPDPAGSLRALRVGRVLSRAHEHRQGLVRRHSLDGPFQVRSRREGETAQQVPAFRGRQWVTRR